MIKQGRDLVAGNWKIKISSSDVGYRIAEIHNGIANRIRAEI
jgi:hypothetical protein